MLHAYYAQGPDHEQGILLLLLAILRLDSSLQLVELRYLVRSVAREEEIVSWLYHPGESHEQQAVYAQNWTDGQKETVSHLS